jgi:hypothetical protein
MSANKWIERIGIEPRTAERFRQQLRADGRQDKAGFAFAMTAAVTAYIALRECGDFEPCKR